MNHQIAVVAHRGIRAQYPDNTLSGFLAAAAYSDAIELDVRRSADGKLVLSHDALLGGLSVSETSWSVLAELDLGDGHKPCLLDEAIAAVPDTPFMIEIKNNPGAPGFEPDHRLALEAATRARPGDSVTSFNWATADAVRASFPDVHTGLIVGVLGDIDETVDHAIQGGHELVIPNVALLQTWARSANASGDPAIYVWANNEKHLVGIGSVELVSLGVSGIITDDPRATRERLGREP
jgi:glycerophosphoryl diester phosphodiesterase